MPAAPLRWQIRAEVSTAERQALEAVAAAWAGLEARPGARILKRNRLRTVMLLADPSPGAAAAPAGWVIKQYRYRGLYDRVRYRILPGRASREYRALTGLASRGFPVPRALAHGWRHAGGLAAEAGLVMEAVPEAVPLVTHLEELRGHAAGDGESAGIPALLLELGGLLRRLHDEGVLHPDLHGGNFLLGPGPDRALHLIDLHSCFFPGWVPRRLRLRGLARMAHSLLTVLPAVEMRWLAAGYLAPEDAARRPRAAGSSPEEWVPPALWPSLLDMERKILPLAASLERRRLRSRTRRCLLDSTSFEKLRLRGHRVHKLRALPRPEVERWVRTIPEGDLVKVSARGWVARARGQDGPVVVKFRRYSILERLGGLLASHRLRRAWVAAHGLRVRAIPAPLGLALVERRRLGLLDCAWLIQEEVPGGRPLDEYLLEEYGRPGRCDGARARRKFEIAVAVGRLLGQLHESGIKLHDMSPQNVVVAAPPGERDEPRRQDAGGMPEGELAALSCALEGAPLWFVDLDDVRFRRCLSRRRRQRNLVQIGNLPEGHVSTADRLRALRAYDGGRGDFRDRETLAALAEGLRREALRTILRMTLQELRGELET